MRKIQDLTPALVVALVLPLAAAETWHEIKSPNFTVLADANDGATRTLVWQLEQIRHVAKTLWPWMRVDLPKPMMVVALRDEQAMKSLLPHYWEQKGGVRPASAWVSGRDQHYIAIRTDVRSSAAETVNPHTSAYFSYASIVLSSSFEERLPLWLTRGLAGVISNTLVRQDDVLVGAPIPWHLQALRERRVALRELLNVTRAVQKMARNDGMLLFDAQAWAFVHYLMFGEEGRNAVRLNAFVERVQNGELHHAAFAAAIGNIDEYERGFHNYVNRTVYPAARYKIDAGLDRQRFPARALAPAESAGVRGTFYAAMGRIDQARAAAAEALKSDPKSASAPLIEALLFERAGNNEEAKAAYARATALGSSNAYALYRSAILSRAGASPDVLEQVEKNLAKAVEINGLFASAHAALAETRAELKRSLASVLPHAHRAVEIEPSNPWHRIAAARTFVRLNALAEARGAAESALTLADDDPAAKAEAQRILAMLKGR